MGTSDMIADFIQSVLDRAGGMAELQRSVLAEKFSCVPSQINYVISTRFSPEHGYCVESRRGGGGNTRIMRVRTGGADLIMHTVNAVGDSLDLQTAAAFVSNILSAGAIDEGRARLIMAALGHNALRPVEPDKRDEARASIFKQMLVAVLTGQNP